MAWLIFAVAYLSQRNYEKIKKLMAAKWFRKELIPMVKKSGDHFMVTAFGLAAGVHLGPFPADGPLASFESFRNRP